MEKYSIILISAIVMVVIVFMILIIFPSNIFSSPKGDCEVILENQGKNKLDIVFFTDNVNQGKVKEYVDYFLISESFINNKEKFNFFYVGESECEIVEENLLFCYSKNLIRNSAVCKNDYIVVLSEHPSNIRSTAYMNVISININHPKTVLLHEFGHVFANLADEYVPSVLPRGAKNCQTSCDEFEVMNGCYEGCCKSSYYRSSQNSVMRTLSISDYKKLNNLLIEEKLEKYE